MTYIHYGSQYFDPDLFQPIRNQRYFNKPNGGLWASPVDAEYGWKQWCDAECFRECREDESFCFTLEENARVLRIDSLAAAKALPLQLTDMDIQTVHFYDFEKLKAEGVDAVEYIVSADPQLYWEMYGRDCDSILILNPDVIIAEVA